MRFNCKRRILGLTLLQAACKRAGSARRVTVTKDEMARGRARLANYTTLVETPCSTIHVDSSSQMVCCWKGQSDVSTKPSKTDTDSDPDVWHNSV